MHPPACMTLHVYVAAHLMPNVDMKHTCRSCKFRPLLFFWTGLNCAESLAKCSQFGGWNGCPPGMMACPGDRLVCVDDLSSCSSRTGCAKDEVPCGIDWDPLTLKRKGRKCKKSCTRKVPDPQSHHSKSLIHHGLWSTKVLIIQGPDP